MSAYRLDVNAIDPALAEEMAAALLDAKYFGASQLRGAFAKSRGFAFVFTKTGHLQALGRAPALRPFFALTHPTSANAFYLNVLVLEAGQEVGAHVDATLRDLSGVDDAIPERVSVLYLRAPTRGGLLHLADGPDDLAALTPRPGDYVSFAGHLRHRVDEVTEGQRVSLVMEQYVFDDEVLAKMQLFQVQTKASFAAYLK